MEYVAVIILIFILIVTTHQDKKQDYKNEREENEKRDILYAKQGNRNALKSIGKEDYIKYVGKDKYEDIMNNRDTMIYQVKEEYRNCR